VGKRKLEEAITRCPSYTFDVSWEPYFLRPNMPEEGIEKAPNTPDNPRVGARMKQAGASVGIDFTGKCDRYFWNHFMLTLCRHNVTKSLLNSLTRLLIYRAPNTMKAHCLSEYIKDTHGTEVQNQFQEKLFEMYFTTGLYPDIDNLTALATTIGLSEEDVAKARRVLESGELETTVASKASRFSRQIQGVPFFIINGEPAFSGAQNVETFVSVFNEC
jgi:predicted DsbA family dithiol-disulfide isomerase